MPWDKGVWRCHPGELPQRWWLGPSEAPGEIPCLQQATAGLAHPANAHGRGQPKAIWSSTAPWTVRPSRHNPSQCLEAATAVGVQQGRP